MSSMNIDLDSYRDDRMFVMRMTSKFSIDEDGTVTASMVREEQVSAEGPVLLITYRNTQRLPAVRTDEFESLQEALSYIMRIEPTCPRLSLEGQSPDPPLTWIEHLDWLHQNGLRSVAEGNAPIPDRYEDENNPKEVFFKKK